MSIQKSRLTLAVRRCPVCIRERRHDGFCLRSRPRHPRSGASSARRFVLAGRAVTHTRTVRMDALYRF